MEPGKISGRLSRGAHGSDRRKVEAGGKEIETKPKKAPKPTKVIDLVSVLQKSLEETGAKQKPAKTRARHKEAAKKAA